MQEVSGNHAGSFGLAAEDVSAAERMWVLSQLSLHMQNYPRWHETITIETWPVDKGSNIRGYRDFVFKNEDGQTIGLASTMWLLLNKHSKRPSKIPAWLSEFASASHDGVIPEPPTAAEYATEPGATQTFTIRASDIDWNMHVNNVCYLEWALEGVPAAFRIAHQVAALNIVFLAEGKYGSSVSVECFQPDDSQRHYLHRITEQSTGKVLGLLRTRWEPKP